MSNLSQEETVAYQQKLLALRKSATDIVELVDSIPPTVEETVIDRPPVAPIPPLDVVEWERINTERQVGASRPEHLPWKAKALELSVLTGRYLFPNLMFIFWEPMPASGRDSFQVTFPGGGETSVTEAEIRSGKFKSGTPIWT